jgi:microcystin-dependent protein
MAHITENLVLEVCADALLPTDQATLQGTLPGFRTFVSKCADGDTLHYLIRSVDVVGRPTGDWETGRGTFVIVGLTKALRRDTVTSSSNNDLPVNFAAGVKYVSLSAAAPNTDLVRFDMQSALGLDFVGMVGLFPVNVLRPGWLKANGAAVSRTTYARLFGYYGTKYGAGDGATTFNLPDYRGEFPRFFDDGRGLDANRSITVVQLGGIAAHTHGVTDPGHAHGVNDAGHSHLAQADMQGKHRHNIGLRADGGGAGTGGLIAAPVVAGDGFSTTEDALEHTHNVTVSPNNTGVSIRVAGTGIAVQSTGISENRPRNVALAPFIRY